MFQHPPYLNLRLENLRDDHVELLSDFSSSNDDLNNFLRHSALEYQKRRLATTVLLMRIDPLRIIGYYSLNSYLLDSSYLPAKESRGLPSVIKDYGVPATLLSRLAISSDLAGQGIGRSLLISALATAYNNSSVVASRLVVVHAIDAKAKSFYVKLGFQPLNEDNQGLFIRMSTIEQLVQRH